MKRFILLFFSFALFSFHSAFAQGFVVKGTVTAHEDGSPLIGVTVLQKGTTNGVVTDMDGNYSFEVKGASDATLVFSYIGMQSQSHQVNASTGVLNVVLKSDAEMIDEVVVVAYGVRKKGTIAGAVSTVSADKMADVPAASFDQALQGQTPGLSVISNSGEPSEPAVFQIRGTNSINSGTAPLFILDGVPISSSDFNAISPGDIESISVLKDASSTSIYGARAANGVVVITSKRGLSMDKAKVTLRAQFGFSQLANTGKWNLMNTEERIAYEKEVGLDSGQDYDLLSRVDVDWLDAVFKDAAPLQSYELSVNRATDRLNYYVSGGFYDQDGIAQGSTFRRYNIRANAEVKASNWLKMGTNTMAAYEEIQQAESGSYALYTPISACRFMLPYWNPYNEDGSIASQNDGDWKSLHDQATSDIVIAHSWFRSLSGLDYTSGFNSERILHEYEIALNTVILAEQAELLEPIVSVIEEVAGIDASSLEIVNRPPTRSKPVYMKVWEARKADGLDYDPEDERQQYFLSQITKYNVTSIE